MFSLHTGETQQSKVLFRIFSKFLFWIMLDWEMQEEGIPVIPIFYRHNLNQDDIEEHEYIQYGNSYSSCNFRSL